MPYEVVKDGSQWVCRKQGGGRVFGKHKTKHEALAQMRALYAAERRAGGGKSQDFDSSGEMLVFSGGSVKAVGSDGHILGYLVRWGSPELPDRTATKDYFTPESSFGRFAGAELDGYYHHGLSTIGGQPNPVGDSIIGYGSVTADDEGLLLKAFIDPTIPGLGPIWEEIKSDDDAYGLSSGAVSHLVRRVPQDNGTHWIKRWPLVEWSLTKDPGEPRTAVVALKSLSDDSDSESWIQSCLKAASDLRDGVARFAKIGPAKREAIRQLRDALDEAWVISSPFDPTEIERKKAEIDSLIARFR